MSHKASTLTPYTHLRMSLCQSCPAFHICLHALAKFLTLLQVCLQQVQQVLRALSRHSARALDPP